MSDNCDCPVCGCAMHWKYLEKPKCPKCDDQIADVTESVCSKASKEQSLKRAIRRLVLAEVDASWAGVKHPSERAEIEKEVSRAKASLQKAIDKVMT